MPKNIVYSGNNVFGVNFGLYGYDDIDFHKTMNEIKVNFEKEYLGEIKSKLNDMGCKFVKLQWYNPKEYNFENDSLDLVIQVVDKDKLKKLIIANKDRIQAALDENRSYDGYMAMTVKSVEEELEKLEKPNYEPDVLVIRTLLDLKADQEIINDGIVFSDEDEEEDD